MVSVTVVPFLLGMIVMSNRSEDFEYTFQVDVKSLFTHKIAQLSTELKCYERSNSMVCRVGKYDLLQPKPAEVSPSSRFNHSGRNIDPRDLDKESEPFQINFSPTGISGYVVERNAIPARLMNVYRMMANQLNMGVDIRRKGIVEFNEMEQSNIGICPTEFTIAQQSLRASLNITLTSYVDLNLTEHKVVVTKQRAISDCWLLSNYSSSARIWPAFSTSATIRKLVHSTSYLRMSLNSFECATQNMFDTYDEQTSEFGRIIERINLVLKSYRVLPANEVFTLDKRKTVLLNVINDDKA